VRDDVSYLRSFFGYCPPEDQTKTEYPTCFIFLKSSGFVLRTLLLYFASSTTATPFFGPPEMETWELRYSRARLLTSSSHSFFFFLTTDIRPGDGVGARRRDQFDFLEVGEGWITLLIATILLRFYDRRTGWREGGGLMGGWMDGWD
jgi:hypothetical protein